MKKIFIFIAVMAFSGMTWAQTNTLIGSWLLTKAVIGDRVIEPYFVTEFKADGHMQVMGINAGTWTVNSSGTRLIMKSELDKDFNGESKILKLDSKNLILEKKGTNFHYIRIDPEKVNAQNSKSALPGIWNFTNAEGDEAWLKFMLPDSFLQVTIGDGWMDRARGTWIFDPGENSLIITGFTKLLKGKNRIKALTAQKLVLENSRQTIEAQKEEPSARPIERLTFTDDEIPDASDETYNQLPWQNFDQMVEFLSPIHALKYRRGKLIAGLNLLKYDTIIRKIHVDTEKPAVKFSNLAVSKNDTLQFSENYRGGLTELNNLFFPQEEPIPFRIVGTQTITVPAGSFSCTVVEGFDGDTRMKYWMINDKPGIYAKIIREASLAGDEPDYSVMELTKIQ